MALHFIEMTFETFYKTVAFLIDHLFFMNVVFIILIVFFERKKPIYTIFWITILALTSYIGFIGYIMFGLSFRKRRLTSKYYKKKPLKSIDIVDSLDDRGLNSWKELINYFELTCDDKLSLYNDIKIYTEGKTLFDDILEEIDKATSFIHMETFILREDNIGFKFIDVLCRKAREGVEVKVILDGVGCKSISKKTIHLLREAGVDVKIFFPLSISFINLRVNYRNHRKLFLIDGKSGYIGGFNIGDEYLGKGPLGNWRDSHLRISGEGVYSLQKEFFISWEFVTKQKAKKKDVYIDSAKYFLDCEKGSYNPLQVVGSAPDYELRSVRDGLFKMITNAKKSILIHTPYFVPDNIILDALKVASLSGVKVRIIIPKIPDHKIVFWATSSFVGELIKYGIDFYRYENGFIHSKLIIVDETIGSIGSSNFDYRSFYQNFEINTFLYSKDLVQKLRREFFKDLKHSTKLSSKDYESRGLLIKIKESICRLFTPLL